jgi:hypothetical protein
MDTIHHHIVPLAIIIMLLAIIVQTARASYWHGRANLCPPQRQDLDDAFHHHRTDLCEEISYMRGLAEELRSELRSARSADIPTTEITSP